MSAAGPAKPKPRATAGPRGTTAVGAGMAGASGGTGMLALVPLFPDNSPWKAVFMFSAPTISVAISGLWVYASKKLDRWDTERSLNTEIKKAEELLKQIENSRVGDDTKANARAKVEGLMLLKLGLHSSRVEDIVGVVTE